MIKLQVDKQKCLGDIFHLVILQKSLKKTEISLLLWKTNFCKLYICIIGLVRNA